MCRNIVIKFPSWTYIHTERERGEEEKEEEAFQIRQLDLK